MAQDWHKPIFWCTCWTSLPSKVISQNRGLTHSHLQLFRSIFETFGNDCVSFNFQVGFKLGLYLLLSLTTMKTVACWCMYGLSLLFSSSLSYSTFVTSWISPSLSLFAEKTGASPGPSSTEGSWLSTKTPSPPQVEPRYEATPHHPPHPMWLWVCGCVGVSVYCGYYIILAERGMCVRMCESVCSGSTWQWWLFHIAMGGRGGGVMDDSSWKPNDRLDLAVIDHTACRPGYWGVTAYQGDDTHTHTDDKPSGHGEHS